MLSLCHFSIRRPCWLLLIAGLTTVVAASGLIRLELRTDGRALAPAAAPEVRYDRSIRRQFGIRDPIVVVVRSNHPNGIFNPVTLRLVRDLSTSLLALDGIDAADLLSLATARSFRFRPGTLEKRSFLEELPRTSGELAQLRDDLRRIELYDGTLVAHDGRSTALLIGVPEGDRVAFYRRIRELVAGAAGADNSPAVIGAPVAEALLGNHILADLGVPAALLHVDVGSDHGERPAFPHRLSELRTLPGRTVGLVPIAVAVMGMVFLVSFRRLAAALLPLAEVGCCLLLVFGLMGWLGVPIYLTIAILPLILTAVGVADEVHIFRRYVELCHDQPEVPAVDHVRATMEELTSPVVRTSVTTAIGFLSFALSPLMPVRALGLFAALGVLVCMIWSLTVMPALLVLVPAPWLVRPPRRGDRWRQLSAAIARGALRHRLAVLAVTVLLTLVAVDGIRRVAVQDSWIAGFDPQSAFARATRRFEEQFLGTHILLVVAEAAAPRWTGELRGAAVADDRLTLPAAPVPALDLLVGSSIRISRGRELAGTPPVARREWSSWVESAHRADGRPVLTTARGDGSPRFWLEPRDEERLRYEIRRRPMIIPAVLSRLAELESFLAARPGVGGVRGPAGYLKTAAFMTTPDRPNSRRIPKRPGMVRNLWRNYGRVRGVEHLRQLVDADYKRAVTTVFLKDSNYLETRRLMAEIRSWEQVHLAPQGIRLRFAGDVAVSQALIHAVVTTQLISVLLSLAGIVTVAALLGGSLRRGVLSVVPPAFAVVLNFAAMGWTGIHLGVATSMFAAMTLGVGVDFSIHLLARYQRSRDAGSPRPAAVADALTATGPAILIDAAAVGIGFAVLILSQVPANARLGTLLVLSIGHCVVATLLLVPALLARHRTAGPR
ncbi:MAG: MMPL family transporter [bacterium]|nr:MMPL family transporter [bacterium]